MRMIDADQAVEEIDDIFSVDDGKGLIPVGITKALVKSMLTLESITPTVCSWISVTDQLPEKEGEYIAFDGETVFGAYYEIGTSEIKWTDATEGYCDFKVTHWMPMPEPPKEVRGDADKRV